jgi:hypothetical protein
MNPQRRYDGERGANALEGKRKKKIKERYDGENSAIPKRYLLAQRILLFQHFGPGSLFLVFFLLGPILSLLYLVHCSLGEGEGTATSCQRD